MLVNYPPEIRWKRSVSYPCSMAASWLKLLLPESERTQGRNPGTIKVYGKVLLRSMLPTKKVKTMKATFTPSASENNLLFVKNFVAIWKALSKIKFYSKFQTVWNSVLKEKIHVFSTVMTESSCFFKRTIILVQIKAIHNPVTNFQVVPNHLFMVTYESVDLYFS